MSLPQRYTCVCIYTHMSYVYSACNWEAVGSSPTRGGLFSGKNDCSRKPPAIERGSCAGLVFRMSLLWRHNGSGSVSNYQPHDCLLHRLFRRRSKKTSKLCVTGLCAGTSPGTGEFPAQMASNAENISIWWRHHVISRNIYVYIYALWFSVLSNYMSSRYMAESVFNAMLP